MRQHHALGLVLLLRLGTQAFVGGPVVQSAKNRRWALEARRSEKSGRRQKPALEKEEEDLPSSTGKKSSSSKAKAARAAAEALEQTLGPATNEHTRPVSKDRARDRAAARASRQRDAGGTTPCKEEENTNKGRREKRSSSRREADQPENDMVNGGLEARLRLRGVAAAESAYAAAELAAAGRALEDDALLTQSQPSFKYKKDASETAAAFVALNASNWPTAVLVGLDVTSRKSRDAQRSTPHADDDDGKSVLQAASSGEWNVQDSLRELSKLCETARVRVVGSTWQRLDRPNGATLVGKGKLSEVAKLVLEENAECVIFDDELTLAQQRNVLKELQSLHCSPRLQILDRTQLVLQIFSERARTREAKTQVALARAEYMLPRLSTFMTTGAGMELRGGSQGGQSASSSGGGGGAYLRGAGESQLEMDRRLYGKRIQRFKADLEELAKKRQTSRKKKIVEQDTVPLVALVGYTNAGKTSLLNALSDASALHVADTSSDESSSDRKLLYADDKLFATLDPTTRRVSLPAGRACRLTDTVGFLQKLPTRLIASFRATLEEIKDACLLIHVVDASSDLAKRHVDAVNAIVSELGCDSIPQIRVLNKLDQTAEDDDDVTALEIGARVVARTSATRGDGIPELLTHVEDALSAMNAPVHALVPFTAGHLLSQVYTTGTILRLDHLEHGTLVKARVPHALRAKLLEFAVDDDDDDDDASALLQDHSALSDGPASSSQKEDDLLTSSSSELSSTPTGAKQSADSSGPNLGPSVARQQPGPLSPVERPPQPTS